jgi:hypothetical protein
MQCDTCIINEPFSQTFRNDIKLRKYIYLSFREVSQENEPEWIKKPRQTATIIALLVSHSHPISGERIRGMRKRLRNNKYLNFVMLCQILFRYYLHRGNTNEQCAVVADSYTTQSLFYLWFYDSFTNMIYTLADWFSCHRRKCHVAFKPPQCHFSCYILNSLKRNWPADLREG